MSWWNFLGSACACCCFRLLSEHLLGVGMFELDFLWAEQTQFLQPLLEPGSAALCPRWGPSFRPSPACQGLSKPVNQSQTRNSSRGSTSAIVPLLLWPCSCWCNPGSVEGGHFFHVQLAKLAFPSHLLALSVPGKSFHEILLHGFLRNWSGAAWSVDSLLIFFVSFVLKW